MTKKEEFEKQGFDVIEGREIIDEEQNHLLEFLKNNYPSIYKDGEINIEEFKRVLDGKSAIGYKENGYGLNFIGRNLAKAKYRQKTEKELSINEKLSKNFYETENIIIKGDNLDSLKILKKYYSSKIKCIYIDPPYNTGSNLFVYDDNFKEEELNVLGKEISKEEKDRMVFIFKKSKGSHNGWLTFMYPRLKLARDLLADDGAIFISIDDNEQANLKLLCDEIFGEDNFIGNIAWLKNNAQNDAIGLQKNYEYILCYVKNKIGIYNIERFEDVKIIEENGKFYYEGSGITTGGEGGVLNARPNLGYSIYYNPETGDFFAFDDVNKEEAKISNDEEIVYNDNIEFLNRGYVIIRPPKKKGLLGAWTWDINKFNSEKENILIKETEEHYRIVKKVFVNKNDIFNKNKKLYSKKLVSTPNKNIIDNVASASGTKEVSEIFNKKVFSNPKSVQLIKNILYMSTKNDSIVLDFFAGSGTTAHAVMEINAEDGGNRKFILCQIDEKFIKDKDSEKKEKKKKFSVAHNFCIDNNFEPVISSITVERVNRAGDKILKTLKESNDMFDDKKIDIGYKVFDLHNVNIEKEDENKQIILLLNGVTDLSRIYNMIINIGLNSPVSKLTPIIENCAYMIEEDNIKRYYITNSEILIKNDENKQKFKDMIESGMVYIDGWTVTINVSLQQYKDNVKIVL